MLRDRLLMLLGFLQLDGVCVARRCRLYLQEVSDFDIVFGETLHGTSFLSDDTIRFLRTST